eukprot:gene8281-3231_t
MFAAEMSNSCGMSTWTSNSQVVHATAAAPEGPYQRRGVVDPPFSHNPTVARAPDGTWVLYHIGCGDGTTKQCTNCSGGTTGKCPGGSETVSCTPGTTPGTTPTTTNVLFAADPSGPQYGKWLSTEQIAELAGSEDGVAAVTRWLAAHGVPYRVSATRDRVFADASVAAAQRALATEVGRAVGPAGATALRSMQ